ncbi:MAG: hypothetical protein L0Z62_31705 [Gemmataceae bacterium]|nr:hypothetical protein [Gemmataceae bacterium]
MTQPAGRYIHYTELPDCPPGSEGDQEWDTFRRELPRLLAEGHEGKFALIKGDAIVGIYPTSDEGVRAGYAQFGLNDLFLVQPIRTWERLLRLPWECWPCRT